MKLDRAQLSNTRIVVKVDTTGDGQMVQTNFLCDKEKCGKKVEVYTDGKTATHNVVCPLHGLLISFSNLAELREFTKVEANKILAANGHELLTDKTNYVAVEDNPDRESTN